MSESKAKTARTPKYIRLADQLRGQIERGERKPGDRLPTFAHMSAEFGLGQATLERVYRLLEDDGLIEREAGKGIYVAHARKGSVALAGTIGMVIGPLLETHPYCVHLLGGVREAVRDSGYELLLMQGNAAVKWEKVDGILSYRIQEDGELGHLPPGMPHVSLLHPLPRTPAVLTDEYLGVQQAVGHLLELGHRKIGYMTFCRHRKLHSLQQNRLDGYRDSLRAAGIELVPHWIYDLRGEYDMIDKWEAMGYKRAMNWLREGFVESGITAVLAHNDETAIGIIEAFQEKGLRVPGDISVAGFDGTEIAAHFRPRLTTIEVPLSEVGARGTRMLLDLIDRGLEDGVGPADETVLPTRLKVGASTGPVPNTSEHAGER